MLSPIRGFGSDDLSAYLLSDEDSFAPAESPATPGRPSAPDVLRRLQRDRSPVRNGSHAYSRLAEVAAPRSTEEAGDLQEALEKAYREDSIDGESYRNLANALAVCSQRLTATVASGSTTDGAALARVRARAAAHARALVAQGDIGIGAEVSTEVFMRLLALTPPPYSRTDYDELCEALRMQYQAGAINVVTYWAYAERLTSSRPSPEREEFVRTMISLNAR